MLLLATKRRRLSIEPIDYLALLFYCQAKCRKNRRFRTIGAPRGVDLGTGWPLNLFAASNKRPRGERRAASELIFAEVDVSKSAGVVERQTRQT